MEINGERAGWASEILYDDGERYRTVSDQLLQMARGESDVVTVALSISYVETQSGAPVEIRQVRRLSASPEESVWTFMEAGVECVTLHQGRESRAMETIVSDDEPWFMPHAAEEFDAARRAAGAAEYMYRTIDVSSGLRAITITMTSEGTGEQEVDGRALPTTIWRERRANDEDETLSETTLHVSSDDEVVLAEEIAGAMRLTARAATREEAQRALEHAPELLAQTVVRPSVRINGADRTIAAMYRLRARIGELPEIPSAGSQRAEREASGTILVTVEAAQHAPASDEELNEPDLLASNAVVDSEDPAVVELAQRALARVTDSDAMARAEALRLAVSRHITRKGLGSAFASASETVRTRSGDCSEHAVLLCALLRASGIPARVCSGLVYAESFAGEHHVFAWHMWTQAQIDGAWVDLDATINGPFSAAHILTGTTDLSEGALSDELSRMVALMGNLDIEVVSVEHR